MCVRWGNSLSDPFHVNNGVRQGVFYLLICSMCIICMDDLSQSLNCCKTGCLSGEIMINHLMYADDLVLLSPSATGLRELLHAIRDRLEAGVRIAYDHFSHFAVWSDSRMLKM